MEWQLCHSVFMLMMRACMPPFGSLEKEELPCNRECQSDKSWERKYRFCDWGSKTKCFTYFMFSRSCCFVSSCLADCRSGLLITVIDMEESGAGCQKPQRERRGPWVCRQSVLVGRGKHKWSLLGMQGLCWPREELGSRGGASLWAAQQKTQLFLMNAKKHQGKQIPGIKLAPKPYSLCNTPYEHCSYAIKSILAQTSRRA